MQGPNGESKISGDLVERTANAPREAGEYAHDVLAKWVVV
jgi:hypothetical protein